MSLIRVLIVDDHPLMREGLALMLREEADLELVGEAGTGEQALILYRDLIPDVTVMDLRLPGMSGTETIAAIRSVNSSAMIVALTTFPGDVLGVSTSNLLNKLPRLHRVGLFEISTKEPFIVAAISLQKPRKQPGPPFVGLSPPLFIYWHHYAYFAQTLSIEKRPALAQSAIDNSLLL